MNDTTIVFDPLWMSVTRALKIVGERLSGYGPDGIDTALRGALRGGDIRAVLLNEPWGEMRLTFEIDRVDWVCVETLSPTHDDVLASAGRAGHDYFFVRLKGWKPNEPPRCGHSTAILENQIIYGLHYGLVEVNRDDLVAWLTKVAPTSPGTVVQQANVGSGQPTSGMAMTSSTVAKKKKSPGHNYREADAPIVEEMHRGIEAGTYSNRTKAAEALASKAKGGGNETSKKTRLIGRYSGIHGAAVDPTQETG